MGRNCYICGKDLGFKYIYLKDGVICCECAKRAGRDTSRGGRDFKTTVDDVRRDLSLLDMDPVENGYPSLQTTRQVGKYLNIDDINRTWCTTRGMRGKTNGNIHRFDDVIGVEILEDGVTIIQGGVGAAVAGGILFGGVGAAVGATVGKKKATGRCSSLSVKITVRSRVAPVEYIDLIKTNGSVLKKSATYKNAFQAAQQILSIFQVMIDERQLKKQEAPSAPQTVSQQQVDVPDEIRKYKKLLDDGILTQEEFDAKKKQLLGL